jgi:superfamily I DNA/RNA helicase
MNTRAFRRFDWSTPSVKLITLHSAKGLSFPTSSLAACKPCR